MPKIRDAKRQAAIIGKPSNHRQVTERQLPSGRPQDRFTLAIDPGEVHCGMALFYDGECMDAWEMAPSFCIKWVRETLLARRLVALVVEQFRLYPWMAEQQAFSDFKTVEVIGVLRYLWSQHGALNDDALEHRRSGRSIQAIEWTTWVENPATIKEPTFSILKSRGIGLVSAKMSQHCKDAEAHGYYYFMHQDGRVPTYAVGRGGNPAEVVTITHPGAAPKTSGRSPGSIKRPASKQASKQPTKAVATRAQKVRAAKKVNPIGGTTAASILKPRK